MYQVSDSLPRELAVSKVMTQEAVNGFARTMGGDGRIHVDPEWATPRYGGTVVHGLLAASAVSQMAVQVFGRRWFTAGRLRLKFVRTVFAGELVTVRCVLKNDGTDDDGRVAYDIHCIKDDGSVAIAGELSCQKPDATSTAQS